MVLLNEYFREDRQTYINEGVIVYDFDDTKSKDFIRDCIIPFRKLYITDKDLNFAIASRIGTRKEVIEERLPPSQSLKSGEFGEILMFFIACKFLAPDANICPPRWLWKGGRDKSIPYTDILLLKCDDANNPKKTDYIYSIEVKSGATAINENSHDSKFNEAINGAIKDKDSRIALTIAYLVDRYIRERDSNNARLVNRFKASDDIPYNRYINAAIVIERNSLHMHIRNITSENMQSSIKNKIMLFAIPINDLRRIYEDIYNKIPLQG